MTYTELGVSFVSYMGHFDGVRLLKLVGLRLDQMQTIEGSFVSVRMLSLLSRFPGSTA
jgi:hypothetical protein